MVVYVESPTSDALDAKIKRNRDNYHRVKQQTPSISRDLKLHSLSREWHYLVLRRNGLAVAGEV